MKVVEIQPAPEVVSVASSPEQQKAPVVSISSRQNKVVRPRPAVMAMIVWSILSLIWGTTWLFIKLGLRDLPPVSFAGIRFVIAAALLSVVVFVRKPALPSNRKEWLLIAFTGFLAFTTNYGLLFWGEDKTSSGLATILQSTIPVFGLVLAHLYLPAERLTPSRVIGVALGMAGVLIIFSNQLGSSGNSGLAGSIAIVAGALAVAWSNVLVKARISHLDPSVLACGQMIFGLIPLVLFGLIFEGNPLNFHWTTQAIISISYLAVVGSSIAFLMFYWLVRHIDVTRTMLIPLITPLIAVVLGMFVLGEVLTMRIVAGGAAILMGIAIVVSQKFKKKATV